MCNIPLLDPAREILDRYKEHPACLKQGVLLPVLSNQKMNAYLAEIADICGITKKISSHTGRHSFATIVKYFNNSLIIPFLRDGLSIMGNENGTGNALKYAALLHVLK